MSKPVALRLVGSVLGGLILVACSSGLEAPLPELETAAARTLSLPIKSALDDTEEAGNGGMYPGGLALDFNGKDTVGLRFAGAAIPKGATISSAYIEFRAISADSGSLTVSIHGNDADSATTFSGSSRNLSSRAKTSASARWYPNSWSKGQVTRTSELKSIVQEIVSRSGWQSGQALAFTFKGSGSAKRAAYSYEKSSGLAAKLVVSYNGGSGENGGTDPEPTNPGTVSSSQKVWLSRLRSSLDSGRYRTTTQQTALNLDAIAASANSYRISRNGNMVATSYVLAYRETGDRKLMDYVNKYMLGVKAQIRDHNGDGYRDLLYFHNDKYNGTDKKALDEMLLHGSLGGLTLALKDAGYGSTADWFVSYLKNDFEPKWAGRGGLRHPLTHNNANYIRFHYAMYKLTGSSSHLSTAKSMASTLKKTIRNDGWSHYFGQTSGNCQPMVYVPLTLIAMTDLATNGSGLIDNGTMQRAAKAVATRAMKNSSGTSLAGNICGSGSYGGMPSIYTFTYTPIGAWDSSGRIESISERVYNALERYNLNTPIGTVLPASLAFTKGR